MTLAHEVEHGDIIILGTDGLWDNLHRTTILDMVSPFVQFSIKNEHGIIKDVSLVAELLAKEAERFSHLSSYISPFSESARAHGY